MAKIYGGRWQLTDKPPIGEGGQSIVFRAIDLRLEEPGELALKRIKNPARDSRFRAELEAASRLSHPNIIRLIDHSALDYSASEPNKQFIVMPIATGGDLGKPERYSLYRDSVDTTVVVAKQLASALSIAHSNNVIHRDVKPENVLFTGKGHEIWLSDFGICLIREFPRTTPADEVVGPRMFIAPELEERGELDGVTPAADVYSLGKVIYFMLSGGVILPRERLEDSKYTEIFRGGERHRLLQMLLRRMICELPMRIPSMDQILDELAKIEEWGKTARSLPLTQAGLAGIDRLRERTFTKKRIIEEDNSAREQEQNAIDSLVSTLIPWLESEIRKVGAIVSSSEFGCEYETQKIEQTTAPKVILRGNNEPARISFGKNRVAEALAYVAMAVNDTVGSAGKSSHLRLYLFRILKAVSTPVGKPLPVRDFQLAIVPVCSKQFTQSFYEFAPYWVYFNKKTELTAELRPMDRMVSRDRQRAGANALRFHRFNQEFDSDHSLFFEFRVSEWPTNVDRVRGFLMETFDLFIELFDNDPFAIPT